MEKEEIDKKNKSIALFMGAVVLAEYKGSKGGYSDTELLDYIHKHQYPDGSRYHSHTTLKYHTNYEWLMPVVDAVEELEMVDEFNINWDSVYENYTCEIIPAIKGVPTFRNSGISRIATIWLTVLEFIEWHENNKEQKS